MYKIAIATQKGGDAKTTTTANLAVAAEQAGDGPVGIVDTDPQGTLSIWQSFREAETPRIITVDMERDLPRQLDAVASLGFKYCFIDTPPALTKQNLAVMHAGDLILIPTQPSMPNLWALEKMTQLVKSSGKPYAFILTHAVMNATSTAQVIAALSAHGRVFPAIIPHSVKYRTAMTDGRTVLDVFPASSQAAVIRDLWKDVKKFIREVAKERISEAQPETGELSYA